MIGKGCNLLFQSYKAQSRQQTGWRLPSTQ